MGTAPAMMPGNLPIAPVGSRFLGVLIDALIVGVAGSVIFGICIGLAMLLKDNPMAGVLLGLGYFLIIFAVFAYETFFIGTKGATIGSKIMKVKVMGLDGAMPIGIPKAAARTLVRMFLSGICFIGYIMIFLDKERHQALHDKIAGTVVVQAV